MFFHSSLFTDLGIDADTSVFLAKVCNDFIDKNSIVVHGEALQNGDVFGFSNKKDRVDTHVALLLGLALMGSERPHDSPVQLDRPNKEDVERFQAERIKQLEREVRTLRGKE